MRENYEPFLRELLEHEGGFVDHPRDPGGATNKGVTLNTYRRYIKPHGTVSDLKKITQDEIRQVYKLKYWDKVQGDRLPSGIDHTLADFAVNSGPKRAIISAQRVVGLPDDGVLGPRTMAAMTGTVAKDIINGVNDERMRFLRQLRHWPTFKNGWTYRVSRVRKVSLELAYVASTEGSSKSKKSVRRSGQGSVAKSTDNRQGGAKTSLADIIRLLIEAFVKAFGRK